MLAEGDRATHDDLVVVPGLMLAALAPLAEARGTHVDLGTVFGRTFDSDRVGLRGRHAAEELVRTLLELEPGRARCETVDCCQPVRSLKGRTMSWWHQSQLTETRCGRRRDKQRQKEEVEEEEGREGQLARSGRVFARVLGATCSVSRPRSTNIGCRS